MRLLRRVAALVGVLLLVLGVTTATLLSGSAPALALDPESKARLSVDRFYQRYVQSDGRVARTDQGGDTVSEGQAYAMLMAAAVGDRGRFDRVWSWTRSELRQPTGLLAWHWSAGRVLDAGSAADADLYAAAALALAADRFRDAGLRADALALSDAILAQETIVLGASRVLVAGPWAVRDRIVNPSYLATPLMSVLYSLRYDHRWVEVAASSRTLLDELTDGGPHLPPDWAVATADGTDAIPRAAPDGLSPRFGWDAVRVPIQLAVDCAPAGQQVASRSWPFLAAAKDGNRGVLAAVFALDGRRLAADTSAPVQVAAAAAAAAAGDQARSARLLDAAAERDLRSPTYYGSAWVALGRIWLPTGMLGGCRPGSP